MGKVEIGTYTKLQALNIGMFLRKTYYLNKKVVRCCGIKGAQQGIHTQDVGVTSVLDWGQTLYSLLVRVNKSEYQIKPELLKMDIGAGVILDGMEIQRCTENIFALELIIAGHEATTMDLSPAFQVSEKHIIYQSMDSQGPDTNFGTFKLILFFIYGQGSYDEEYLRDELYRFGDVFTVPVDCTCSGTLMFDVTGTEQESTLTLEWNDQCSEVMEVLKDSTGTLHARLGESAQGCLE